MKYEDFKSFKDCDRRIYKVTNIPAELKKGLNLDKYKEPLYGIIYHDYECGATFRVLGNSDTFISDEILLIRSESFEGLDFEEFEGTNEIRKVLKNEIEKNYYDENLNILLKDSKLDRFRYKEFPFDVKTLLVTGNNVEEVWVRLITRIKDDDNCYVGQLLNDSNYDKEYSAGTVVGLKFYKEEKGEALNIIGIMK